MGHLKKATNILLCFVLLLCMIFTASADEFENEVVFTGAKVLSVQTLTHEAADALLMETISASGEGIATYGYAVPTEEFDLSYKESYYFEADTTKTAIYSNYYFTGHNGKLDFDFFIGSNSGDGDFILRVFKKGWKNTKVYDVGVPRLVHQTVTAHGFESSDKVYFVIIPDGTRTVLNEGTRIKAT